MVINKNNLVDIIFALVVCTTCVTIAVRAIGDDIRAAEPTLGDIVSFADVLAAPGAIDPDGEVVVAASRADGPVGDTCTLDSAVMEKSGGSLFVEAEGPSPRIFRVHWAGGATSQGASDCGRSSELLLSANQLGRLAESVGGFGIPGLRRGHFQGDAAGTPAVGEGTWSGFRSTS